MLAANTVDGCIDEVVDEGDDTGRVAEEGASTGDLVENGVESETERGVVDAERAEETFSSSKETSDGKAGEVGGSGAVAEVVGPASGGHSSSRALHARWRTIGQVEVFKVILAQAGQRREGAKIERRVAEEGCCVGNVFRARARSGR